jgi:hypothetical protein
MGEKGIQKFMEVRNLLPPPSLCLVGFIDLM